MEKKKTETINKIKISFIVPLYNSEIYLIEMLDSLMPVLEMQSSELILIDDGSTDNTVEIIKQYEFNNKHYNLFNRKHEGVSSARNFGIMQARGEYVTFIDADDIVTRDLVDTPVFESNYEIISVSANTQKKNDSHIVHTDADRKSLLYSNFGIADGRYSMYEYHPGPVSKFYKKKFLIENKLEFDERIFYGEDMLFNAKAILLAQYICLFRAKGYKYRTNLNSVMHNKNSGFFNNHMILIGEFKKVISNRYPDLYQKVVNIFLSNLFLNYFVDYPLEKKYIEFMEFSGIEFVNPEIARFKIEKLILTSLKYFGFCFSIIVIKFWESLKKWMPKKKTENFELI